MRAIKDLTDVQVVLKQLDEQVHKLLHAETVDFAQRRIVNAHPSKDPYDYVVRKELKKLEEATQIRSEGVATPTVDYDIAVFGIAIETNIETGEDVCPHHIAVFNGRFIKAYAKAKTAPVGSAIQFDIKLNGVTSIFNSYLEIPSESDDVETSTDFAVTNIEEEEFLTIDVKAVGSTIPGSTVVVKLKYRKL